MPKNMLACAAVLTAAVLCAMLAACKAEPASRPGEEEDIIEVNAVVPQQAAPVEPAELFKQSCAACHKIEKAVVYSGETPWKDLVARMIQHNAKITPENAAIIVKYLETTYPQKKPETF